MRYPDAETIHLVMDNLHTQTLFIAENVNNWGIEPQGPFVLALGEGSQSRVVTPTGLLPVAAEAACGYCHQTLRP